MADNSFDVVVIGSAPAVTSRPSAASDRHCRTGGICMGLHSDQGAAALGGNLSLHDHAKDYGLSADNVSFDPKAVIARSRGVVKRLNGGVEFLMKKNKISIIWGEATLDAPGKFTVKRSAAERRRARWARALTPPSTSSSPPARVRACCRVLSRTRNWSGPTSRRWPGQVAEVAAGGRLRRHRHRVRLVLPHHGRGGDGGGSAAADSSRGGRGDRGPSPASSSRSRASRSCPAPR
jgi:hypothetical protein